MVSSMAGFAINDALVKSLGDDLSISQILGVRGLMVSILIVLVLWQRGLLSRWKEALIPMVGFRASMELAAAYCFLMALVQLPFASVSAILQALPLAVTLGAALVFREVVGWRRWSAIVIGFIGVLIIIRPGTGGFAPASLWVVVSVVFAASRDLSTRALPASLPSLLVTAATALLITVFGLASVWISGDWVPLNARHLQVLALASVFLFVGYQFIVLSMRTGDIAYVVPYRYTNLLWSIFLGYLFYGEVPDAYTILGSSIVIAMGLFTLYRELVRPRQRIPQVLG
ncbi:Riboflavin transporter [Granulosicoccus antarcticus IMCC3135]|uniref:Riboflavin transporter n=2 Tax=Granulosicoccus TaxID=437504 RepID=A0A2Z2NZ56_9GAMM|nr:Riboflavin transporter [Granulosicoccus antarcticus IMCC3135]